jgi:hypothetical protein
MEVEIIVLHNTLYLVSQHLEMQADTRLLVLEYCTQHGRMDCINFILSIYFEVVTSKRFALNILSFSRSYRKKSG